MFDEILLLFVLRQICIIIFTCKYNLQSSVMFEMLPSPSRQRTTQLYLILELIHLKLNGTRLPEIMHHTNNIAQIFSPCHVEGQLILVMCKKY